MWRGAGDELRALDPLSRTPRRSSQVLPPKGRMSFLTIWDARRVGEEVVGDQIVHPLISECGKMQRVGSRPQIHVECSAAGAPDLGIIRADLRLHFLRR